MQWIFALASRIGEPANCRQGYGKHPSSLAQRCCCAESAGARAAPVRPWLPPRFVIACSGSSNSTFHDKMVSQALLSSTNRRQFTKHSCNQTCTFCGELHGPTGVKKNRSNNKRPQFSSPRGIPDLRTLPGRAVKARLAETMSEAPLNMPAAQVRKLYRS